MFRFNLVTSSLSQFSACKISSLLPASGTTTQKYLDSFCLNHPTISQQVLWHTPSHRYQIDPASAPTFLALQGARMAAFSHMCAKPLHQLFSHIQNPYLLHRVQERAEWCSCLSLPKPCPFSARLPILCVTQDGKSCSLLQTERKSILSLLSAQLCHLKQSGHTPLMPS